MPCVYSPKLPHFSLFSSIFPWILSATELACKLRLRIIRLTYHPGFLSFFHCSYPVHVETISLFHVFWITFIPLLSSLLSSYSSCPVRAKSLQSCPTLCNPMDCSLTGSSVHWILSARILERAAMPSLQGIFPTQGKNPVSLMSPALAGGFFTTSATWKAPTWSNHW